MTDPVTIATADQLYPGDAKRGPDGLFYVAYENVGSDKTPWVNVAVMDSLTGTVQQRWGAIAKGYDPGLLRLGDSLYAIWTYQGAVKARDLGAWMHDISASGAPVAFDLIPKPPPGSITESSVRRNFVTYAYGEGESQWDVMGAEIRWQPTDGGAKTPLFPMTPAIIAPAAIGLGPMQPGRTKPAAHRRATTAFVRVQFGAQGSEAHPAHMVEYRLTAFAAPTDPPGGPRHIAFTTTVSFGPALLAERSGVDMWNPDVRQFGFEVHCYWSQMGLHLASGVGRSISTDGGLTWGDPEDVVLPVGMGGGGRLVMAQDGQDIVLIGAKDHGATLCSYVVGQVA